MQKSISAIVFLVLLSCTANPQKKQEPIQAVYSHNSFEEDLQRLVSPIQNGDLLDYARLLMDSAYVGKTLEVGNDSLPVINIHQFDCLTFVENSVALDKSRGNPEVFVEWITRLRYRNGEAEGYTSRLHYFSDWILDNVEKGVVKDISCEIGGEPILFDVHFMSRHPQYYPQLKDDSTLVQKMSVIEKKISETSFCYIPKERVKDVEQFIFDGDILGITTNIEGLDFAHNGLAIHQNGRLYMLHASSDFKKVMITEEPLADYLAKMKHMTGICVLRLL